MNAAEQSDSLTPDQKLGEMFNRQSSSERALYVSAACANLPSVSAAVQYGLKNEFIVVAPVADHASSDFVASGTTVYAKTEAGIAHYTQG